MSIMSKNRSSGAPFGKHIFYGGGILTSNGLRWIGVAMFIEVNLKQVWKKSGFHGKNSHEIIFKNFIFGNNVILTTFKLRLLKNLFSGK